MQKQAYSLPVYRTEDYSIFKKLAGNRELYQAQVKRLEKIIDQNPEFTKRNPIKVNEQMEIIDGQHRIAAFERYAGRVGAAQPVYYIIEEGARLADARSLNAGAKAWTPKDYASAYAQEGNPHYKTYLKFEQKYRLNHNVLCLYLAGETVKASVFRDGLFAVADEADAADRLDQLAEVGPFYHNWPSQPFALAYYKISHSPVFSFLRFREQMQKNSEGLNGVPDRQNEMLPALNMVYNWGRKDKLDLLN